MLEGIHAVYLEAPLEPMIDWRRAADLAGLGDHPDDELMASIVRLANGSYVNAAVYSEGNGRVSFHYVSGPTERGLRAVKA
jgi:hypothetical protein